MLWAGLDSLQTVDGSSERLEVRVFDGLVDKGDLVVVTFWPKFEVVLDGLGFEGKTWGHSQVLLGSVSMFE